VHPGHLTWAKPATELCNPCQQELLTREIENYQGLAECMESLSCTSSLSIYEDAVILSRLARPKATLPIIFDQFSFGRDFSNSFTTWKKQKAYSLGHEYLLGCNEGVSSGPRWWHPMKSGVTIPAYSIVWCRVQRHPWNKKGWLQSIAGKILRNTNAGFPWNWS